MTDYDDQGNEERWCAERQTQVTAYLKTEGVHHGRIGEWPAWHLAPFVAVWAIESLQRPGWVGWWAICGDLPSDYVSAETIKHPKEAMRAIAERWLETASSMTRGEQVLGLNMGEPNEQAALAPLLKSRAEALLRWSIDESLWSEDAR